MIYFILGGSIIIISLLYNHFKYNNAKIASEQVQEYVKENCKKNINNSLTLYYELSQDQKLFLDNFSEYIECDSLRYQLNSKVHNIFCLDAKKIKQTLKFYKLLYKFKNCYCSQDVYIIIDFIDGLYHKYLENNKIIDFKLLNISLFGKENIDDEGLLKLILTMTLKEFVLTFSSLIDEKGAKQYL